MNVTVFGATGALGGECMRQALQRGHKVTVLVRDSARLTLDCREQLTIIEGDALNPADVERAISATTDAVLFAIGVDERSPKNLCADTNRIIFDVMKGVGCRRFIWCGGGSNFVPGDQLGPGAYFVKFFAATFMSLRHADKEVQLDYLGAQREIDWLGVRPLQMKAGPKTGTYRLGFNRFNGMSRISFADCAHAMLGMLDDNTWLHQAPVIQY